LGLSDLLASFLLEIEKLVLGMHFSDMVHLTAGLFQLVVAWYALRLGRVLGAPRTGWLMFGALSLLAVAYMLLALGPFFNGAAWPVKADSLYAWFSAMLLVGMANLKRVYEKQLQGKKTKQIQLQNELENRIGALSKANENWPKAYQALEQEVVRIQDDAAEQKAAADKLADTNTQLVAANEQLSQANSQLLQAQQQLQQSVAALEDEIAQHKMLLDVAAQTASAQTDAAPSPESTSTGSNAQDLPRINELIDGVNAAVRNVAEHLSTSGAMEVSRIARQMRQHSRKLGEFMTRNPRGKVLPNSLAQLARHLADEHALLAKSLEVVRSRVENLRRIAVTPSAASNGARTEESTFAAPAGPAAFMNSDYTLQAGETETGTTIEAEAPPAFDPAPQPEVPSFEPAPELLPEENAEEPSGLTPFVPPKIRSL
jgi:phage shock protein A